MHARKVLLLWLVLSGNVWAQRGPQVWMTWQLELEGHTPPRSFLLTVTSPTGAVTPPPMSIPWASCQAVPGAQHCAPVGCPPVGTYDFTVYALYEEGQSAGSNLARCEVLPGQPCQCRGESTAPLVSTPPPASLPKVPALPPLQTAEIPPLPQRGPEGLHLQPIGPLPALSTIPAIPPSTGT